MPPLDSRDRCTLGLRSPPYAPQETQIRAAHEHSGNELASTARKPPGSPYVRLPLVLCEYRGVHTRTFAEHRRIQVPRVVWLAGPTLGTPAASDVKVHRCVELSPMHVYILLIQEQVWRVRDVPPDRGISMSRVGKQGDAGLPDSNLVVVSTRAARTLGPSWARRWVRVGQEVPLEAALGTPSIGRDVDDMYLLHARFGITPQSSGTPNVVKVECTVCQAGPLRTRRRFNHHVPSIAQRLFPTPPGSSRSCRIDDPLSDEPSRPGFD
jgi:hypothetical protein